MKVTLQSHNIINAARHIDILGKIFGWDVQNPFELYEILLKAEREARRQTTKECNEAISDEESEKWSENFIRRLTKNLGIDKMPDGFFINYDPRGYALKMKEGTFPQGLWTDWGGYGILAPEF